MPVHPLRFRHHLAALALLAALGGCADPDPLRPAGAPAPLLVDGPPQTVRTDPATLVAAEVRGDRLRLQVTFGGGCREHSFALYASDAFLESDPVQLRLYLAHDARGDNCRALLARELEFDLAGVRQAYRDSYGRDGTVMLLVHAPGAAEPFRPALRYSF